MTTPYKPNAAIAALVNPARAAQITQANAAKGTAAPAAVNANNPGGFSLQQTTKNPHLQKVLDDLLATAGTGLGAPNPNAVAPVSQPLTPATTALGNSRAAVDQESGWLKGALDGTNRAALDKATNDWQASVMSFADRLAKKAAGNASGINLMGGGMGGSYAQRILAGSLADLAGKTATDVGRQRIANEQWVTDQGNAAIGRRTGLEAAQLGLYQQPFQYSLAEQQAMMQRLGQLGALDANNNFYGVAANPTPYQAPVVPQTQYNPVDYTSMLQRLQEIYGGLQ